MELWKQVGLFTCDVRSGRGSIRAEVNKLDASPILWRCKQMTITTVCQFDVKVQSANCLKSHLIGYVHAIAHDFNISHQKNFDFTSLEGL